MTLLTNKTILITGSTGGFGTEFAKQLLQKGNRLILTDLSIAGLHALAKELDPTGESGQIVATIPSDLSRAEGAVMLFSEVQKIEAMVDVLINNAGIGLSGHHHHVPDEAWERLMQVNLLAPMRLCSLFVPQMVARGSGHIINISSVAGWIGAQGLSAYVASKFGLRGFSESLANELRKQGVGVSAVYPYFSRTPILESPRYSGSAVDTVKEGLSQSSSELGFTEPADVVAETISQIERGNIHIHPDRMSRIICWLQRHTPWLLRWLMKRLT